MTLAAGRELSHYRLVEPIGEGGMGVVWRATDTTLGRDVAIKVLPALFAGDPERMARFDREARLLASLNHPHIASIYGVGVADGVRFLAMELVEGEDLAARISHGPMPVAEAVETARQIAEGLEFAHEKGIVHRDLKPANVKLTPDGQVKVLDFGLAKALEGDTAVTSSPSMTHSPTITSPMTAANVILGTAAYMSPEQARGKVVDRRADIWAFGCVLYECLTGRRAFSGETVSDTIAKILERDPDFGPLPGGTPPRVRELLQRCLDKDPKRRLRDIGDARITLEEVLAARSPSGRLLASDTAGAGAARRAASSRILAVVGAACLVAGAGLWALFGPRPAGVEKTRCVTISMPADVTVRVATRTRDGGTVVLVGQPRKADGTPAGPQRIYTRRLDQYEFKELPGTEDVAGFLVAGDHLLLVAPVSVGSPQLRLSRIPLDGNAPATGIGDWDNAWGSMTELGNGDLLVIQGRTNLVRIPRAGGAPSAPVKLDAGRPGVSFYEFARSALPGDRGVLLNVVAYDARGWHYSIGVMDDPRNGKVRIIEEDGGNPAYLPTGHLLFSRGNVLMAMPFDAGRGTPRGAPVAVWSGLSARFTFLPAPFHIGDDGALFYRPGQLGGERQMGFVGTTGRVEPWAGEPRAVDGGPEASPDGRRFACSIANARGIDEIWISDLERPGYQKLGTDPDADCSWATWSRDGRQIAYIRHGKDGRDGVYVQSAEGGEAKLVFKPRAEEEQGTPFGWLPDGSALLLAMTTPTGGSSIALLRLAGDPADSTRLRTLLSGKFTLFWPRFSPEGRRLAYGSDEAGKMQVYVAEFRADGSLGRPVQVRTAEGSDPQWSRDGKTLFVVDERRRLMKVAVGPAPDLSISAPEEVFDLDKLGVSLWTVLPDGRFFVGLKNDDEGEITKYNLVLGWTEELKRKMRGSR